MTDPFHITVLQSDLCWQDVDANLDALQAQLANAKEPSDLVVLPETFNTGFTMQAEKHAESMSGKTFEWMMQMARKYNAAICGSYIVNEAGKFYNRLYFVQPDGNFYIYNKRHLYRMGGEDQIFTHGNKQITIDFKGWKIHPLICYDLRFPVWSKNYISANTEEPVYDILLYVANWPASRTSVWETLLRARAMENQCFCVGCNRIGMDGQEVAYEGHSTIIDFKGNPLAKAGDTQRTITAKLDKKQLTNFRKKFPVFLDWDNFQVIRAC